jgi:hypothetical protein
MRKPALITILISLLPAALAAQVLNTATVLRPGSFSLTVAPILYVDDGSALGLDLGAGFGIARNVDLELKAIVSQAAGNYIGGDVEFALLNGTPSISLTLGAHAHNEVGLDGTFNITFPLTGTIELYTGVDADAEFRNHAQDFPLWIPVGLQVMLRRNLGLVMEIDIAANDPAPNMFALGLNIFL